MPELQTDVLVVGAGAIGLNTAYYLQKAGADVTVVDRGGFGTGCSFGNAGLLVPSHLVPLAAPGVILQGLKWMLNPESPFYIKLRLDPKLLSWLWAFGRHCTKAHVERCVPVLKELHLVSRDLTAQIAEDEGLDFEYQQQGLLMLFHDAGRTECEHLCETANSVGMHARLLNGADAVRELDENIDTIARGGLHIAEDAVIHPAKFVSQLADVLEQRGVRFLRESAVQGMVRHNGAVQDVATSTGRIQAKEIVLAAGSWTPQLARQVGVRVPIEPAKGYSITFPKPANAPRLPLLLSEAKVAVTPFRDQLRLAGTLELAGFDLKINQRRVNAIRKAVPRYLTGLEVPENDNDSEVWAGLRPCTPDGLPIVGRVPGISNLTLAAGHAMQGISLASATGKLVAEVILGERPFLDLTPLRPERF